MTTITSRIRKTDGGLIRVHPDGREEALAKQPIRPMTDAEVEAAALGDPDARPLAEEEVARARPIPRAKIIRRALGLTQEEFAVRYHIPVGTLRDWEQGRAAPTSQRAPICALIAGDAGRRSAHPGGHAGVGSRRRGSSAPQASLLNIEAKGLARRSPWR